MANRWCVTRIGLILSRRDKRMGIRSLVGNVEEEDRYSGDGRGGSCRLILFCIIAETIVRTAREIREREGRQNAKREFLQMRCLCRWLREASCEKQNKTIIQELVEFGEAGVNARLKKGCEAVTFNFLGHWVHNPSLFWEICSACVCSYKSFAVWQREESVAPVCIILYIRYELILDRLYEIEIYCLGYLNWFSWLKWSILAPSADCISYEFDLFSVSKYLVCIYIFPFHGDEVFEPHTAFRPMSDHILWFVAALCSIKTIRRKICIVCLVLLSCHTAE